MLVAIFIFFLMDVCVPAMREPCESAPFIHCIGGSQGKELTLSAGSRVLGDQGSWNRVRGQAVGKEREVSQG